MFAINENKKGILLTLKKLWNRLGGVIQLIVILVIIFFSFRYLKSILDWVKGFIYGLKNPNYIPPNEVSNVSNDSVQDAITENNTISNTNTVTKIIYKGEVIKTIVNYKGLYTESWYKDNAQKLYNAVKDDGTDEKTILDIIYKIPHLFDFNKLKIAFGVRDYKEGFEVLKLNLNEMLSKDLSDNEKDDVNRHFKNYSIPIVI